VIGLHLIIFRVLSERRIKLSKWDDLWDSEKELCSTAEIFMNAPDYAYVMSPWLEKVKAEGDKMQEQILFLQSTVKALADQLEKYQSSIAKARKDE